MSSGVSSALDLARTLTELAAEKKARRPRLLGVSELTTYTDYVLILTATSDRHARALADHLTEHLKSKSIKPLGVEGYDTGQWILLDFNDVIVHVFQESSRDYYDLDGLWTDAESLPIEDAG
jgi:ribosome-associated protein